MMSFPEEGIRQAKEASEIFEQLDDTAKRAECLIRLAYESCDDKQLDAAEEAASRAIGLPEKGEQLRAAKVTVFSVTYIAPRAIRRRPSAVSR